MVLYLIKNSENRFEEVFLYDLSFDGIILIESLTKNKLNFKIKALKGEIYWIRLIQINTTITFRCFFKILPISWKKLIQIENRVDLNISTEILKKEDALNKKQENIIKCLNKTQILKSCLSNLLQIIKNLDLTVLDKCFSAPSISYFIFFKSYNTKKIAKQLNDSLDEYCRKAYKGGRCEVFGNPQKDEIIKYFDFPGMYGLCMQEKFHNGGFEFSSKSDFSNVGFHTVTYRSNSNLPILPSYSSTKKLLFRNGIFTDTIWFEELLYFIENGGEVLDSHHSLIFEKFEETFTDYVTYFTDVRKKKGYYNIFGKLMVNSLYGSLALKKESVFNYITFSEIEFLYLCDNFNVEKFYKINNVFIILINIDYKFKKYYEKKSFSRDSNRNVSYSAAITAKARIKLHKLFIEIEKDGGRILYCDTDSIFASYKKNRLGDQIDKLEWNSYFEDAVFVAPKFYALKKFNNEEIIKIKGISSNNISFDTFKTKFYENSELDLHNQKITSKKDLMLFQKNIPRNINFDNYDKRHFSNDKKFTTPIFTDSQ